MMPKPDLSLLLDRKTLGDQIDVLGIRIGDDAEKLRSLPITAGEPDTDKLKIMYGTGGTWKVLADGRREKLTIEEIKELVLGEAGRLRVEGVVFTVRTGRVTDIVVRDESLDPMGISSEEDLLRRFGEPGRRETTHYSSIFHYEDRALCLVFDVRSSRLDAVCLGRKASSTNPHSSAEVMFGGGVVSRVSEIRQGLVYEGLLEGLPTEEGNEREIRHLVQEAEKAFRLPVEVVRPRQIPLKFHGDDPYPFGTPAKIPGVWCMARFSCSQFARNPELDFSALAVIWFQDQFAFPISEDARREMTKIPWRRVAKDLEL